MNSTSAIGDNLLRVQERIYQATQSCGRTAGQVRLIVVTKGHPIEIVEAVVAAGAEDLGENYVEEALPKIGNFPVGDKLRWHMIGHVQSRKAKEVSEHFNWVHSVDSIKLARRLDRFAGQFKRQLPVLLECNVSGEETKFGWPAWNELNWGALVDELSPLIELENIILNGLMTMAPYFDQPEAARPFFQRLRKLRDFFASQFPQHGWQELSMGMSGDFEVAIQEGATMVRIGTAIVGARS